MKKKLIVHIGAGKCGSSAIQAFLAGNTDKLRLQGMLVPGEKLDTDSECIGHQLWFFQNGIESVDFKASVKRRLKRLHRYMNDNDLDSLIVSGENLINPAGFHELFTDLEDIFSVEILAYVRRQDDFMISAWQQWYLKIYGSFEEYANEMGDNIDWHASLKPWADTYGSERIKVRIYEKEQLKNGNVIEDFCESISIDYSQTRNVTTRINRSLHEKFNVVANKYRHELFKSMHDNEFYQFLADIYGEQAFKNYSGSTVLTLDQRKYVLSKYEQPNARLYNEYFSDGNTVPTVFKNPVESDCHKKEERFDSDSSIDYMLVGMFGMYKRMRKEQLSLEKQLAEFKLQEVQCDG